MCCKPTYKASFRENGTERQFSGLSLADIAKMVRHVPMTTQLNILDENSHIEDLVEHSKN